MASLNFICSFEEVPNTLPSLQNLLLEHTKEGLQPLKLKEGKLVVEEKKKVEQKRPEVDNKKVRSESEETSKKVVGDEPSENKPSGSQGANSAATSGSTLAQAPPAMDAAKVGSSSNIPQQHPQSNRIGVRPPSPSYAGPSRRVGGGVPTRPGSAPLGKHNSPPASHGAVAGGIGPSSIITSNASYVERWMRNLYSRQDSKRQQTPGTTGMGRNQTDPVLAELDRNKSAATNQNKVMNSRSSTPGFAGSASSNTAGTTAGGGVYRPPRGGSASRFRSEVNSVKPLPSQTSYVLPSNTRHARHRQVMAGVQGQ